ncbi:citrate lyase holo-[acyl-carrier protein] synthase [Dolosicoccus paucivorans]
MKKYADKQIVELKDVLELRDERNAIFHDLFQTDKNLRLITFNLNVPGPRKTSPLLYKAYKEGQYELLTLMKTLKVKSDKIWENLDYRGYSSIYEISNKARKLSIKRELIKFEESKKIARIWDFDLVFWGASGPTSLSRREIDRDPRKCLLCGADAKECARSRRHSIDELDTKITELLEEYFCLNEN